MIRNEMCGSEERGLRKVTACTYGHCALSPSVYVHYLHEQTIYFYMFSVVVLFIYSFYARVCGID